MTVRRNGQEDAMTPKQALDACVEHWQENYEKAPRRRLGHLDVGARKCALCVSGGGDCDLCPLAHYGMMCIPSHSPWGDACGALLCGSWKAVIETTATMLTALLFVREAERG